MQDTNLITALRLEINRNKDLLDIYKTIPTGAFAYKIINGEIAYAEKAIDEMDTVAMVLALQKLRDNK